VHLGLRARRTADGGQGMLQNIGVVPDRFDQQLAVALDALQVDRLWLHRPEIEQGAVAVNRSREALLRLVVRVGGHVRQRDELELGSVQQTLWSSVERS